MSLQLPPLLPAATRALVKGLQSSRNPALQALIDAAGLRVGDRVSALVQAVRPLSPGQRQLLQRAIQQLPAGSELQKLLRSPDLQLARLTVKGHPLLAFTEQPLRPRQTLELQLTGGARLAQTAQPPAGADERQRLIDSSLRTLLPRQAPLRQLFRALDLLAKSAPGAKPPSPLPQPVQHSLDQLRRHLPTPRDLSRPEGLARVLAQVGTGFESRLNQLRQPLHDPGDRPSRQRLGELTGSDLKAALLLAARRLETAVQSPPATVDRAGTGGAVFVQLSSPATPPPSDPAGEALLQLITRLGRGPAGASGGGDPGTRLLPLLYQQVLASLAKLQLLQLRSLPAPGSQGEAAQASQSWHLEIPVRLAGDVHSIELRIDREWVEDEAGHKAPEPAGKIPRWEVALSIELPDGGALHAHLRLVGKTLAARLWAERQETLDSARASLHNLRRNLQDAGLEVTDIHCHQGRPPNRGTRLDHSLVDITT